MIGYKRAEQSAYGWLKAYNVDGIIGLREGSRSIKMILKQEENIIFNRKHFLAAKNIFTEIQRT